MSWLRPWLLGAAWGALAAWCVLALGERRFRRARGRALARTPGRARRVASGRVTGSIHRHAGAAGRVAADLVRRRARRRATTRLAADVPVAIDLLAVAAGAGCTPYESVALAVRWSPPSVTVPLRGAMRDAHLGVAFADALDAAGTHEAVLRPLTDVLAAGHRLGAPIASGLARLAAEARADARRRAEARARAIPVQLLFPLVFLVLPAFGLLTVVPAILAGLRV